ncbi:MAG: hydrogenase nickel incorporation protein HypB [Acidobacteriota bacterium]
MCDVCGCGDKAVPVEVRDRILAGNERQARHNRQHFHGAGVLALNVMGSPGAGKTALLEATARRLAGTRRLGALAGDLATENDATRLRAAGVPALSITTGSACHLDAEMVHHALHHFDWTDLDYLFIENVGNLVCPAVYDLGQAANVVLLAVHEGEDKPLKYPVMFHKADLVVLTKVDLVPFVGADLALIEENLARVMPDPRVLRVSARSGEGLDAWIEWIEMRRPAGPRLSVTRHHHEHRHHAPPGAGEHDHEHGFVHPRGHH